MRLEILNSGYTLGTKVLFWLVRLASGSAMPDAARLVFYRPDFYGNPMKELTHEAMRGPSEWSVAERELMAAYVSKANENTFCIGAHTATASLALADEAKVAATLADPETAPVSKPLRAMLLLLGKLTSDHTVTPDDLSAVLAAGVSPSQIEDALAICFAFNVTNRLADAFGFEILRPEGFAAGARVLLKRGYR